MKPIYLKVIVISCIAVIFTMFAIYDTPDKNESRVSQPDLLEHPVYSKYEFKQSDSFIRIGVQPLYLPSSLIMETLKRDNILKEELSQIGLEILFFDFLKGDDVNFFLARGDIDAGVGGDMPALTAAATLDIIVPSMIQRGFVSIVANRHMLIEDLEGKRIGYAFGSNAHYALLKTLSSEGLSEDDVKLIPFDVTQMPEALHSKKIIAFSAWEPTPAIALKNYTDSTIIHQRLSLGFFYLLETLNRKHPKAVSHILAAQIRAIYWMQERRANLLDACEWNISTGEKAFGKKIRLSVDDIAKIAMKDILGYTSNPRIPEDDLKENESLDQELKFLVKIGKVPASSTWTQVGQKFQSELLNKIWSDRNQFRLHEFNYSNGN